MRQRKIVKSFREADCGNSGLFSEAGYFDYLIGVNGGDFPESSLRNRYAWIVSYDISNIFFTSGLVTVCEHILAMVVESGPVTV